MEMQREQERDRNEEQLATGLAQTAAHEEGAAQPGYWGVLTSPDIKSDIEQYDEYLQEFLSTELSGQQTIGNISRDDWQSWCWRIEYEMWMVKNEFQDSDSRLDEVDMATMGYGDRPKLSDRRARRLRSAEQVRKMMLSNSIDARGQRSGTEIHAVARTEAGEEEDDGEGGSRISKWLGN